MRWRWIAWAGVLVGMTLGAGCTAGNDEAPQGGHREQAEAAPRKAAEARAREHRARVAEARVRETPMRRATARPIREPARPGPLPVIAVDTKPPSLEEELARLAPAAAIERLEGVMGRRFDGAHYVLQGGSEAELVDAGWQPLSGELSLIDCTDPQAVASAPTRTQACWVGGLALEDPPEILLPAFERRAEVALFGGRGPAASSRWKDLKILRERARVTAFGRELDLWLETEGHDHATVGRLQLVVDAEARSLARFQREEDACPYELELHLVLQEVYQLYERSDGQGSARAVDGGRETTTLGRVILIARQISSRPEIFELGQRAVWLSDQTWSSDPDRRAPSLQVKPGILDRRTASPEILDLDPRIARPRPSR